MMNWRRHRYPTRANSNALKKAALDEDVNAVTRRFGTELTRNIFNNQNHRAAQIQTRKRTFKQLDSEAKEEEKSNEFDEFEKPAKRARYNLRSRVIYKTESSESSAALGKENANGQCSKPVLQKNKTMDVDTESDEDIDLIEYNKQKQKKPGLALKVRDNVDGNNKNQKKIIKKPERKVPLRRSLRLKNKRERKLREENERKEREKEAMKMVEEPEYILDDKPLDCDLPHLNDDLFVTEYISDITDWYLECEESVEQRNLIRSNYISSSFQKDLNDSMRCILLNWLFNVHRKFKLTDSTLFLGIYIMDGYLSTTPIKRSELQLIGSCSMWIASKYHEIYAPEAHDFVYISNYAFQRDTLFETEIKILTKLKFRFANIMTPLHFIERYLQIATYPLWKKYEQRGTAQALRDGKQYISLVRDLTFYFAELALFDCKVISTQKPSIIAAASICFAILSISLYTRWPDFLQRATNYKYEDFRPILVRLNEMRRYSNSKLLSIRKKHKDYLQWIDRLNIDVVINNQG